MSVDVLNPPEPAAEVEEVSEPARLAAELLGGEALLGVDVRAEGDFVEVLDKGVPAASLEVLTEQALSADEADRLIIAKRTLASRKAKGQPLTLVESERAVRVAWIIALAEDTFVDRDKAYLWLRRRSAAIGGRRPLDLLETEPGARIVERMLYQLAYGIAA